MPSSGYRRWIAAAGAAAFVAFSAQAQRITPDPSAAEVGTLLRSRGKPGQALAVLTQARQPQSKARLDEMADTLTAIAIGFKGDDTLATSARMAAVTTLLTAGSGTSGSKRHSVIPYDGAADRLMRIVDSAQTTGTRAAALYALTKVPTSGRLIPFLRKLSTSNDPLAYGGITHLAESTGPEGLAVLRAIYESGKVSEPSAVQSLRYYAKANRWPCPGGATGCD